MVPNVSTRGQSFKGVTAYLMHDKNADTSERVAFTETRNLPFQDVERASKFMAWTDMSSETLKDLHAQSEGREPTGAGRPSTAGNVYHMSLSWRDDQEPSEDHMKATAHDAIKHLGLDEHEYYLVGHNDTDHRHVHAVVNLVHPVTGKVGNIYEDHDVLDRWANEYQHENGEIVCENRADKFAAWENDQPAFSAKERKAEARQIVNDAYHSSDSGKAFKAALEANGFDLAQGRKRSLVVVDQGGEVYNQNRLIEGAKPAEIKARLKDIDKTALPHADELQEQRKHFDRDAAEAKQQDALIEAAEAAAQQKASAEDKATKEAFEAAANDPHELGSVVRTTERGAQGVVAGYEDGRYSVTFSNQKTGKQFTAQFKPQEIELLRTPQQQSDYEETQERKLSRWQAHQLVRERQTTERIEERRQYWQIDKLEVERDQAQTALDEKSGWLNRYVLRWRLQDAREELEAKDKNLIHAQDRWLTDINTIQERRTAQLRADLERQGFFENDKRADKILGRADVDAKSLEEAGNRPDAENRMDAILQASNRQKLQRDMSPKELAEFKQNVRADIQQELGSRSERLPVEQEKLQRDMNEQELDAYRERLRAVMREEQAERDRRGKGRGLGHVAGDDGIDGDIRGRDRDAAGGGSGGGKGDELGEDQDLQAKEQEEAALQRDMTEEEEEALREQIIEEMQQEQERRDMDRGHDDHEIE